MSAVAWVSRIVIQTGRSRSAWPPDRLSFGALTDALEDEDVRIDAHPTVRMMPAMPAGEVASV